MRPVFAYHEGTQETKPAAIDAGSSKETVFLRKDIARITREDKMSGETVELWAYQEAELTRTEYAEYMAEDAVAKAEYIAMMADIEMEE